MRNFDFAPLWRSTIGFDRVFDLMNETQHSEVDNYPPYDVLRTGEDSYRINLAVAGFSPDEITITAQQNKLTITGRKTQASSDRKAEVLYQGISARPFERTLASTTMSRSRVRRSRTGCCRSIWCGAFPRP